MSKRSGGLFRTFSSIFLVAIVFTNLSSATPSDRIPGAIDSSRAIPLQNSVHPKAQAQYDRGPVDPSFKLPYMTLMTAPSATQQQALNTLLVQQQDRSSSSYHKWLTPAQYGDRFGLSQNDMNRITAWLKSQGFVIRSIGGGHNSVIFSGTAAQVKSAFQAEIHLYNVNGEAHFANATPLMIPSALSGIVTGVIGVHNFLMHPVNRNRLASSAGPKTRPNYYDNNFLFPNFIGPADAAVMYDINGLYNMSPAIDGTGETLAIVGETDIYIADINNFRSGFGMTTINCTSNASTGLVTSCNDPHFQYILVGSDPGIPNSIQDDLAEADLDVEWSGAIAPGAQIVYINSPDESGTGVIDSLGYAINPPSGPVPAPVVSMSYGSCELENSFNLESELAQGLAEGITIVSSSGDSGAAACDDSPPNGETTPPFDPAVGGQGVVYPASSASVIAAGGNAITLADDSYPNPSSFWNTSNTTNGESLVKYIPEIPWNDDEEFASYCQNPAQGDTFCSTGNNTNGWEAITSAQIAQKDLWISAGGGGASNCFTRSGTQCESGLAQPSWQSTLNVPNAPSTRTRWVPDVSFLASPNFPGYIFCTELSELGDSGSGSTCSPGGADGISNALNLEFPSLIGGTSVSAPLFAGMVTLLNQYLGGPSSQGLGDIHPMLYKLALSNSTNKVFNPIITGDNKVYCQGDTPSGEPTTVLCPNQGANAGIIGFSASDVDPNTNYNLVAGLGSVNATALATTWNATRSNTSLTVSPSETQIYASGSVTLTATVTPASAFPGNVTFSTGTTVLGTVALKQSNGQVTAQLETTALPVGSPDNITATYNGNSGALSSNNTTSVTVVQAFTLSANASTYTVTQGQSASVIVTVNTNGSGFNGNLTYTCSDSAPESICTGPTLAVSSSSQASFSITTTPPTGSLRSPFDRGMRMVYAMLLPGLFGIVFAVGSRKRSSRAVHLLGMVVLLGLSTVWMSSCSGSSNSSSNNPGTSVGNYTVTITASSASGSATGATGQVQVTLAVQQ